jgi:hypothetical protein
MGNTDIDDSSEASLVKGDFGLAVAYFGLAMCMLAAIYAASTSPGTAIGDFTSMAVYGIKAMIEPAIRAAEIPLWVLALSRV